MNHIRTEVAPAYAATKKPLVVDEDVIIAQALSILASRIRHTDALTSPDLVQKYLTVLLSGRPDEHFGCIYLDNQHRVIDTEELFRGTIDGASVYPRVVVRHCLEANAAAVIFFHNHPSGVNTPSDADRLITTRLKQALNLVDIRVLDHLIVGGVTTCSFAEQGLI